MSAGRQDVEPPAEWRRAGLSAEDAFDTHRRTRGDIANDTPVLRDRKVVDAQDGKVFQRRWTMAVEVEDILICFLNFFDEPLKG